MTEGPVQMLSTPSSPSGLKVKAEVAGLVLAMHQAVSRTTLMKSQATLTCKYHCAHFSVVQTGTENLKLGVVAHIYNHSTQEAEAGGS
jgi:hypothetical protein